MKNIKDINPSNQKKSQYLNAFHSTKYKFEENQSVLQKDCFHFL